MPVVLVFRGGPLAGWRKDCVRWPPRETIPLKEGAYVRGDLPGRRPGTVVGIEYRWEPA
jgi:hypothetical protein